MNGINVENLNSAINRNDGYYDSINDDVKFMLNNINELNNLYSGSDLHFLFQDLVNQVKNISLIPPIIKNYSDVLNNVKLSYKAQDINMKSQINRVTSETNM